MKEDIFKDLVGQDNVKKKLNFYLEAFEMTSTAPFLLFVGAKGLGKTLFARRFARALKNHDKSKRAVVEINCSSLKNVDQFFEQIVLPLMLDNDVTIFFDEAHELPKSLMMALLTILEAGSRRTATYNWQGNDYIFDMQRNTFFFATTESDKLFPPLKDRLTSIDFEPYESNHLSKILKRNSEGIQFNAEALELLSDTVRGNARNAVMTAKNISLYCISNGVKRFDMNHYKRFCNTLGILPKGITCTEREVLEILEEKGACSLAMLAAKTGLSATALRCDHEKYLLRQNLMEIDTKRKITPKGKMLIKSLT